MTPSATFFVLASPFYHWQTYYLVIVEKLTSHGDDITLLGSTTLQRNFL